MESTFGIDVSHYQGKIDWGQVTASGKKFVVLKAQYESSGHGWDPCFKYNYENAIKNGLDVSVYDYFGSSTRADPEAQAKALAAKLKAVGYSGKVWMDHENPKLKNIGKIATNRMIEKYALVIIAAGYSLGIYCNKDWYCNVLDTANLKKLYEFWIARYPAADFGVYNPVSTLSPKMYSAAWQYSSKGKVPGIKGNVDLDIDFDGVTNHKPVTSSVTTITPNYSIGKNYTLLANMYVRTSANGEKIKYSALTINAKAHAINCDGTAVLKKGTKVTCKAVEKKNSSTWIKIPSGWICGIAVNGRVYVK